MKEEEKTPERKESVMHMCQEKQPFPHPLPSPSCMYRTKAWLIKINKYHKKEEEEERSSFALPLDVRVGEILDLRSDR